MSLTNKSPSETYKDILYVDNSNSGVDGTAREVKSGNGSSSCFAVSDSALLVKSTTNNTRAFKVVNSGATEKFLVDTSNNYVKANGVHVNTNYARFGISYPDFSSVVANTHYAIPSAPIAGGNTIFTDIDFGTGTDPDTTFTTADTDTQYASQLVPCLFYVPDNISIDAVTSIEGADNATGDTTRMHLYSFTFTSGSTSALTSGTLLAHNTDVTNAGNEQAYLSTWTIDSASVTAGKVLVAFFRNDSINSDYSLNITCKYHITG